MPMAPSSLQQRKLDDKDGASTKESPHPRPGPCCPLSMRVSVLTRPMLRGHTERGNRFLLLQQPFSEGVGCSAAAAVEAAAADNDTKHTAAATTNHHQPPPQVCTPKIATTGPVHAAASVTVILGYTSHVSSPASCRRGPG